MDWYRSGPMVQLFCITPSISEIIWVRNVRAIVVCGFFMKSLKKHILKIWKKSWVPFGSYLLDSTADSAQFEWKWAGLAVLFSRYLPNGTHDFFQNFRICFIKDFIKNPQTTIALTLLTHIIYVIDGVNSAYKADISGHRVIICLPYFAILTLLK